VKQQDSVYLPDVEKKQQFVLNSIKQKNNRINREQKDRLSTTFTARFVQKSSQASAIEPGSSNWLNALPLKEYGFYLEKYLYLRYNIPFEIFQVNVCVTATSSSITPYRAQKAVSSTVDTTNFATSH